MAAMAIETRESLAQSLSIENSSLNGIIEADRCPSLQDGLHFNLTSKAYRAGGRAISIAGAMAPRSGRDDVYATSGISPLQTSLSGHSMKRPEIFKACCRGRLLQRTSVAGKQQAWAVPCDVRRGELNLV
jgi:hypothetical protein